MKKIQQALDKVLDVIDQELANMEDETEQNELHKSVQLIEKTLLGNINEFDEWKYYLYDKSGVGIVINYFYEQELEEPHLNIYVVPKEKAPNNNWHDDMYQIGD